MFKKINNLYQVNSKNRGFSLIELVIYIGVASLIILILSGTIVEISRIYIRTKIYHSISQNGNNAMKKITQEVLAASSVNTDDSNFIDEPNILALNVEGNNYGRFFIDDNGSGVNQLYFVSENTTPSMEPMAVTSSDVNVVNFLVSYSDSYTPSLKFNLTLSDTTARFDVEETYITTADLRTY